MSKPEKILLFSHDPGGANTIIPLAPAMEARGWDVQLYGKGFALARYQQWGLTGIDWDNEVSETTPETVKEFLSQQRFDRIVTGTSAVDPTEKYIWQAAAKLGIPSMAILDQWINYGIRFSPYSTLQITEYQANPSFPYLPDAIGIMDEFARQEMIDEGLPKERLYVTGQPYFQALRNSVAEIDRETIRRTLGIKSDERVLVFVSEPLTISHGEATPLGYSEKSIFSATIQALQALDNELPSPACLLLKLHPKELPDSFNDLVEGLQFKNLRIITDQKTHPWEVLVAADWLLGMSSILLIEAVLCSKPVLSVQIGLRQTNPLVLCRQGVLNPILDAGALHQALRAILIDDIVKDVQFEVIKNPVENVLDSVALLSSMTTATCH